MTRRPPKSTLFPYPPLSRSNTTPCPAGAGRKVASVRTPVCRPVPETVVFLLMPRLGLGLIGRPHERLEIVHDESEPVQRTLGPQKLPVRTRRVAGNRGEIGRAHV